MEQVVKKSSPKPKNKIGVSIKFRDKNYVYNYIKIVTRQLPQVDVNIEDITFDDAAVVLAKHNYLDDDILRLYKDKGKYFVISGKNQLTTAISKEEKVIKAKIVTTGALQRTLVPVSEKSTNEDKLTETKAKSKPVVEPAHVLSNEQLADKLSHNDKWKLTVKNNSHKKETTSATSHA